MPMHDIHGPRAEVPRGLSVHDYRPWGAPGFNKPVRRSMRRPSRTNGLTEAARRQRQALLQSRRPGSFQATRAKGLQQRPTTLYGTDAWVPLVGARVRAQVGAESRVVWERRWRNPNDPARAVALERSVAFVEAVARSCVKLNTPIADDQDVKQMYRMYYLSRGPQQWRALFSSLITDINLLVRSGGKRTPRGLGKLHDAVLQYEADEMLRYNKCHLHRVLLGAFECLGTKPLCCLVMNAIHRDMGAVSRRAVAAASVDEEKGGSDSDWEFKGDEDHDAQAPGAADKDGVEHESDFEMDLGDAKDDETDASDAEDSDDSCGGIF